MNKNLKNNRAMTIVVVMIFLLIAGIVGIMINYVSRSHRAMSYHSYHNEVAYQIGNSSINSSLQFYFNKFNDKDDSLYKELTKKNVRTITLPSFYHYDHEGLKKITDDYPGAAVEVSGKLDNLENILSSSPDKIEKKGQIELTAHVTYKEVSKKIFFSKNFKFVNVVPPVVSRFTMFLKNPSGNSEAYNNISSRENGTGINGTPTVFVNGSGFDITKNGWIYFGENRINLNLARGENNFGEDFHLPDSLTRSLFFPKQSYALLNLNVGFWSKANKQKHFQNYADSSVFNSSCLRLFGCSAVSGDNGIPSPTFVIGDVWRRYLQAAAMGPVKDNQIKRIANMPWINNHNDLPVTKGLYPGFIMNPSLYKIYMSQSREEPYNRSYDYITSSVTGLGTSPPPLFIKNLLKGSNITSFQSVYPIAEPDLDIRNFRNETIFTGKLRDFSMEQAIINKRSLEFESLEKFIECYKISGADGPVIDLNGIYHIRGKKKKIDNLSKFYPFTIGGRGVLIFDYDVAVPQLELMDPEEDMVSIISLKGNIQLTGRNYHGNIIALNGEIKFSNGTSIIGNVACNQISPDTFRRGGIIKYDERINPEQPVFSKFYTLELDPKMYSYRED